MQLAKRAEFARLDLSGRLLRAMQALHDVQEVCLAALLLRCMQVLHNVIGTPVCCSMQLLARTARRPAGTLVCTAAAAGHASAAQHTAGTRLSALLFNHH